VVHRARTRRKSLSRPESNTIFGTASAVPSGVSAIPSSDTPPTQPHQFSPYEPAYSPIVLAGLVRAIEMALVAAVGFTFYVCYVVPGHGFAWYYFAAILGIALLAMLAFRVADIYQTRAFRGHGKQYMGLASAWSVKIRILRCSPRQRMTIAPANQPSATK
jgi:hypothetical protein